MSEPLELATDLIGGVPFVRMRGPLMYGCDLGALHALVTSLRGDGHARVVLDMAGVQAIDSSGLAALLDVRATIGTSRGRIMLLRPSRRVRDALRTIRVDALFEVIADEGDLIARLRQDERTGEPPTTA